MQLPLITHHAKIALGSTLLKCHRMQNKKSIPSSCLASELCSTETLMSLHKLKCASLPREAQVLARLQPSAFTAPQIPNAKQATLPSYIKKLIHKGVALPWPRDQTRLGPVVRHVVSQIHRWYVEIALTTVVLVSTAYCRCY